MNLMGDLVWKMYMGLDFLEDRFVAGEPLLRMPLHTDLYIGKPSNQKEEELVYGPGFGPKTVTMAEN